jgi:hypothetical protein
MRLCTFFYGEFLQLTISAMIVEDDDDAGATTNARGDRVFCCIRIQKIEIQIINALLAIYNPTFRWGLILIAYRNLCQPTLSLASVAFVSTYFR